MCVLGAGKILLTFAVLIFFCAESLAYKASDARGNEFEFRAPPRAISILPSATESIFAIGADEFLIADSRFCRFPEGAKNKEKIGAYMDPDYEKIARLTPDIFIAPHSADGRLESALKRIGVRCFFLNEEGLQNIAKDLILLGKLFDKNEEAAREVKKIDEAIFAARTLAGSKLAGGKPAPRAVFMFGKMTAGNGSYVGDLMKIAGLKNTADSIKKPWFVPAREFMVSEKIDVILVECKRGENFDKRRAFFYNDAIWKHTNAVKNGNVFPVDSDIISIPGPRITLALRRISEIFSEVCDKRNVQSDSKK